jgi:hypothetical protein
VITWLQRLGELLALRRKRLVSAATLDEHDGDTQHGDVLMAACHRRRWFG